MRKICIYWCRKDFRLLDNPALFSAIKHCEKSQIELLPIYIIDIDFINEPKWNFGYTYRSYLSNALANFVNNFSNFRIIIGSPDKIFEELATKFELDVFAGNEIEPYSLRRDKQVKEIFSKRNSRLHLYNDQTSVNLNTKTQTGNLYSVFTPFRNNVYQEFINCQTVPKSDSATVKIFSGSDTFSFKEISFDSNSKKLQKKIYEAIEKPWILMYSGGEINLENILPKPDYSKIWYTNEEQALRNFVDFNDNLITNYGENRNLMGLDVNRPLTSRASVALAWGFVSSRTLVQNILKKHNPEHPSIKSYLNELIWREFFRYIMFHNPHGMSLELQVKKRHIMWRENTTAKDFFEKWIKGQTGYKIVDAAMHQIAQTGWMHNRARMIVASILTKNFGIDWRWGQDYFRSVLLDLDEASNNGGWQWGASVGADPKPIRIFNPYSQQEKFDPDFKYINHYLPAGYNITAPIIDHSVARQEALLRYKMANLNS